MEQVAGLVCNMQVQLNKKLNTLRDMFVQFAVPPSYSGTVPTFYLSHQKQEKRGRFFTITPYRTHRELLTNCVV